MISLSALLLACFGIAGSVFYMLYGIVDLPFRYAYFSVAFFFLLLGCIQLCGLLGLWVTVEPLMIFFECATAVWGVVAAVFLIGSLHKIMALSKGRREAALHSLKLEQTVEDLGMIVEQGGQEVRSCLQAIRAPTQKLLQRNPSAEDREELERIQQNAESLLRTIDGYFEKNPARE